MNQKLIEGKLSQARGRYAIISSRFNRLIVQALEEGALDILHRHGISDDAITLARVPGALELPLCAQQLAESGNYDALIVLGAVIRGETAHFDVVVAESAKGIAQTALKYKLPIINGILTTNTLEQAMDRAGSKSGNKGADAALAALEMVDLISQIKK